MFNSSFFYFFCHAALFAKLLAYYALLVEILAYYVLLGGILAYSTWLGGILARSVLLVAIGTLSLTWSHFFFYRIASLFRVNRIGLYVLMVDLSFTFRILKG